MLDRRYAKAQAVLAALESMYGDRLRGDIEAYRNGREHGYGVCVNEFLVDPVRDCWQRIDCLKRPVIYFAEFRRSDGIVVYVVENSLLGELSKESYENAKFFGPDAYVAAAKYIWRMAVEHKRWEKEEKAA